LAAGTILIASAQSAKSAKPADAPAVRQRPNILFIAIDDLNDWVGPLRGHPQVQTPHMDRLARRGTVFTNAHCQAPLCNPSRASLLTGLRPSTTGVYALEPWFRTGTRWKDWVTLPQHFAANGYRTLTTGKIFHDAYPPAPDRTDGKEFSVWGYHGSFGPRPAAPFVKDTGHPLVDWGVFPERDEDQDDWKVAEWAIGQLRRRHTQPFFLSVGLRHPHVPCYAGQKWFDLYPEQTLRMPPLKPDDRSDTPRFSWYLHWSLPEPRLSWLEKRGQAKPLVRAYLASISFVDSQVGRILDALDQSGQAKNTVVVLWSDHGWHLGEKGITGKNTLWDRSTRVPLIIAGPGVAAGARTGRPAELLDLYPTLSELCGLPARRGLEGHSLVPQLKDARAPRPWPAITTQGPGNHSVRTERWRYIRYADGSEELYDMRADPNEWTNLADQPRHAARKRALARWLPKSDAPPLPGSRSRLVELRNGTVYWEGQPVARDAPIPGHN
jgi:arylsulfatase A-like enzyme